MKFKESALAHQLLDGLQGIEIGGAAHNPFGLNTRNVDYSDDMDTVFKQAEEKLCGEKMPVDIIASGDDLPLESNSVDFVISSHVIEHIFDPIRAIKEWWRVTKPNGYIYIIAPLKEHVPGEQRPITRYKELWKRHWGIIREKAILQRITKDNDGILGESIISGILYDQKHGHWTVFDMDLMLKICQKLGYPVVHTQAIDDEVGNGFTVVIRKSYEIHC